EPYDEVVENGKTVYKEKKSPNGILPTIKSFFSSAEQSTWIAWKQVNAKQKNRFQERMSFADNERSTVRRLPLSAEEVKNFYHVTSKEAFWPILHSFPWQFTYESSDWENFQAINRKFADAACEDAADDAVIWIHDYNLWLTHYYIRQQRPNVKIIFFHHTPFPGSDAFNVLPWREDIIDSLLCCDVCGFHIPRYVENFVSIAQGFREIEIVKREPVSKEFTPRGTALAAPEITKEIRYKGQLVRLGAFPVGTNVDFIRSVVERDVVKKRVAEIREEMGGDRQLIVSAGRVDYVKGTKEMLLTYERLLTRRPELQGKVNFVVAVAKPATGMRIYKTAQSEIERLVGKINGRFAKLSWTPILLFTSALPLEEILALYAAADIAWITPLRDGLNLVGKEFVVAKGGKEGVLIFSEFAGAAVELPDAVLTNPYADSSMDKAIDQALAMDADERNKRMGRMYEAIKAYDVDRWGKELLGAAD
ncbi:MAG: glucosylglycerol-phosphate synthase, partial [Cyanobacteria bacterium P01_C01_bin.69]